MTYFNFLVTEQEVDQSLLDDGEDDCFNTLYDSVSQDHGIVVKLSIDHVIFG